MDQTQDSAAPEQGATQPEATGTAPAKSAAETKIEGQLAAAVKKGEGYKKERDAARADLSTALATITSQGSEIEQLKREKAAANQAQATQPTGEQSAAANQEPSEEEYIKDVLRRNGLKIAYMLPIGPCLSENHAREFAGEKFDSLTTISLA